MSSKPSIYPLLPNRVWRSYGGGKMLDQISGKKDPADSHFPEDWIFSTTQAVNPGRETIREGVSLVPGEKRLTDLIAEDPDFFLGADYVRKYGQKGMLLVKYLDSSVRLHFQAHPTAEFSKKFLNSPSGKTEAYHILAVRPDQPKPYIYIGFQKPPTLAGLKRMVESQDIAAIEACFEKIPVAPGDTFIIPGGRPHAIGEGVLMVEVMEPTDFVTRFEFEKYGYTLPEAARFMNRGIDFGLSLFNLSPLSVEEIRRDYQSAGEKVTHYNAESYREKLIWEKHTRCFSICRSRIRGKVSRKENSFAVVIATQGSGTLRFPGGNLPVSQYDRFFLPHGLGEYQIESSNGLTLLESFPPE